MNDTTAQTPIVARKKRDLRTAFQSRIGGIAMLFGIFFTVVCARLWHLQVVRHEQYTALAARDATINVSVPALRAPIMDRNGDYLAYDEPCCDLSVRIERLQLTTVTLDEVKNARKNNDRNPAGRDAAFEKLALRLQEEQFVKNLSLTTQRSREEIAENLLKALDNVARNWSSPRTPQRLLGSIDTRVWQGLRATHEDVFRDSVLLWGNKGATKLDEQRQPPYPGLVCTVSTRRVYPLGHLASHVIGVETELQPEDENSLRDDFVLLDNDAARTRLWSDLRERLSDEQAQRAAMVLRKDPREIETLSELYDRVRVLRPHETQALASYGLSDAVRWCERPPRMKLTEPEQELLKDGPKIRLPDRSIGETGIERYYNDWLRGKSGRQQRDRYVRSAKDSFGYLPGWEPQEGRPLALTISTVWQKAAENALKSQEHPGAAVVLDVHSGDVLALASWPDFDPNLFSPPREGAERQTKLRSLLSDPAKPLLNRAISEQYPLGSVMKTLVGAWALEKGVVTPEEEFECKGYLQIGQQKFRCDQSRVHGLVNLGRALRVSCNGYYHQTGARMGAEGMAPVMKLFFGTRTGIDLPAETPGIYPDRAWRLKTFPNNAAARVWSLGHDYQLAIGQGMFTSTVLQAACMMSAVASGGDVYTPRLWLDGSRPQPRKLGISQRNLDVIRQALDEVANCGTPGARGTAYGVFHTNNPELAVRVAGKTSTAEHKKGAEPHAWFVGYAPADNPQVAFAVMLEEAGHGGSEAAPVVYQILKEVYGTRFAPVPNPGQPRNANSTASVSAQ